VSYKLVAPQADRRWAHWRVRGTEFGVYVDRSTQTGDRKVAQRLLTQWKGEAKRIALAGETKRSPTFAEAALAYMEAGGERRFLLPLLKHFMELPLSSIGQGEIDAASTALYPNATPATRNRQVYSPMSAIMKRAGLPAQFKRPKGAQGRPRLVWLKPEEAMRLLAAAEAVDPRLGALCTFLLYTGCRLSEAIRLEPKDLHLEEHFAYVRDTKNGSPRPVHLPAVVGEALGRLAVGGRSVFMLTKCGRLYAMLSTASEAAGVEIPDRVAFHIFRHSYGAWMRRYSGLDTTGLVATGAWKSRVAASVYEHADVTEEARKADLLPTLTRAQSVREVAK
jgi:integrase